MKTKIISIIIVCLILFNCIPAYASTNVMVGDDTVEEIKVCEDEILNYADDFSYSENYEIITAQDIDYSKAIKSYYATGLFENESIDADFMSEFVKDRGYLYYLPISRGGKTVLITISKWSQVGEDGSTEIVIGPYSSTVYHKELDYKDHIEELLKNNNIQNAKVYFVDRYSNSINLMAVICNEDTQEVKFCVLDSYYWSDEYNENHEPLFDSNALYSYDELKAVADKDYEELQKHPDSYGSGGGLATDDSSKIIIISAVSAVAIVIIAVTSVIIIKKRRKNNSGEQI